MKLEKYEISDVQVDQIARVIYKDVAKYIIDHRDEPKGKQTEVRKTNKQKK